MMAKAFTRPYYFEKEKKRLRNNKNQYGKNHADARQKRERNMALQTCKMISYLHPIWERQAPPPSPSPSRNIESCPLWFSDDPLKKFKRPFSISTQQISKNIHSDFNNNKRTQENKYYYSNLACFPPLSLKKKFARRKRTFNFWLSSWAEPGLIEHIPHD